MQHTLSLHIYLEHALEVFEKRFIFGDINEMCFENKHKQTKKAAHDFSRSLLEIIENVALTDISHIEARGAEDLMAEHAIRTFKKVMHDAETSRQRRERTKAMEYVGMVEGCIAQSDTCSPERQEPFKNRFTEPPVGGPVGEPSFPRGPASRTERWWLSPWYLLYGLVSPRAQTAMAEVGADDGRDSSDGSNGPTGGTSPDDGTGAGHEASSGGGIQELGTSLIYNARLPLQSTGTAGRARGTARTEDSAGSGTADGATVCANRGDRPVRRAALQACAALHASVAADSNDDRDNDDDDDDDIREDDEDEDSRASQEEGLARHIDYSNDDGNDEADFDESEVCKHARRALPCQAVCACRARVLRVCRSCVHACVCASVRASVHLCVDRSVRPSILPLFFMQPSACPASRPHAGRGRERERH